MVKHVSSLEIRGVYFHFAHPHKYELSMGLGEKMKKKGKWGKRRGKEKWEGERKGKREGRKGKGGKKRKKGKEREN